MAVNIVANLFDNDYDGLDDDGDLVVAATIADQDHNHDVNAKVKVDVDIESHLFSYHFHDSKVKGDNVYN